MKVAVIGATGVVGETILRVLEERNVAGRRAAARTRRATAPTASRFAGTPCRCAPRRASGCSPTGRTSRSSRRATMRAPSWPSALRRRRRDRHRQLVRRSACADDVPLVVPEVNPHAVRADHRIFPVANCTAIVLRVALAPIERAVGLRSVRVATYQAVSGAGRAGLDALAREERGEAPDGTFAAPILRNVVPQVGSYDGDGDTGEEQKVAAETRKMLDRPELASPRRRCASR